MRRVIKYLLMIIITLVISLICLYLPSEISKWQDQRSFGVIRLEKAEDIKVERNQQMTMLEKLKLYIYKKKLSSLINIKQGKYLKEKDLPQVCERELKQLIKLGILNNISADLKSKKLQVQPMYYLSIENPTKSMIVWEIDYYDENGYMNLILDDETGKILSFMDKTTEQVVNMDAKIFIKELGQYYGINVDDYDVKKTSSGFKTDTNSKASLVTAVFSEGNDTLSCGIQIYPNAWYYY